MSTMCVTNFQHLHTLKLERFTQDIEPTYFGPVKDAFEIVDEQEQKTLFGQLEQIYTDSSEITNATLAITASEYLEVIATRS